MVVEHHSSKTKVNRQIGEPKIKCATNGLQNWSQKLILGGFCTVFDAESGYDSPGAWREIRFFIVGPPLCYFSSFCYLCQVERLNEQFFITFGRRNVVECVYVFERSGGPVSFGLRSLPWWCVVVCL